MSLFTKSVVIAIVLLFVMSGLVFADDSVEIPQLQSLVDRIVGIYSSNLMKGILTIVLGGMIFGAAVNRQNEEMKKRFFFFAFGSAGLLSLSFIMGEIFAVGALI